LAILVFVEQLKAEVPMPRVIDTRRLTKQSTKSRNASCHYNCCHYNCLLFMCSANWII